MPNILPFSDKRLAVWVLAGLIAVLTVAATSGSPVAAATAGTVSQDERFQPHEMRVQPMAGARTVLKPAELPQPRPFADAKAAGNQP